jgi:dTMP kinase
MDPLFIVVDGADGVGTTTASKGLVKTLNEAAIQAVWTKEPSDGIVGRHIRKILKGEELAEEAGMFPLFLADRWDHISNFIRPHIEQGETVVCDRYYPSTWVYQQDNYPPEIIEYMHRKIMPPDYVFILVCPPEIAAERMTRRDIKERYDSNEKQELYAERYSRFSRPAYIMRGVGFAPVESGAKIIPTVGHEEVFHISTLNTTPAEVVADMLRIIQAHGTRHS